MRISLVFVGILLPFLGLVYAEWKEGPYYDPLRKTSMCGRNVTGWRNYLNSVIDVPLDWVAEVILGNFFYIHEYREMLLKSKFKKLAEATDPGKMGEWTTINDTWRERKADMGRAVYNNPFIKHASMTETQRVFYTADKLLLNKLVRNKDAFLSGLYLVVEYCAVAWGENKSHVEIDAMMVFENPFLALLRSSIEEEASNGFVEVYDSLGLIFQHLAENPEERVPLNDAVEPVDSQFFPGAASLSTDTGAADEEAGRSTVTTDAPATSFWTKSRKTVFKYVLGTLIIVSFCAACFYIVKKLREMHKGEKEVVAVYRVNEDGFETVELDHRLEIAPLRAHE